MYAFSVAILMLSIGIFAISNAQECIKPSIKDQNQIPLLVYLAEREVAKQIVDCTLLPEQKIIENSVCTSIENTIFTYFSDKCIFNAKLISGFRGENRFSEIVSWVIAQKYFKSKSAPISMEQVHLLFEIMDYLKIGIIRYDTGRKTIKIHECINSVRNQCGGGWENVVYLVSDYSYFCQMSSQVLSMCSNNRKNLTILCHMPFSNLRSLHCTYSSLHTIYNSCSRNLQQLRKINISHNQFQEIPQALLNLPHLNELNIENNQITSIPDLSTVSQLEVLIVRNNKIFTIDAGLNKLQHIEKVYFSNNPFIVGAIKEYKAEQKLSEKISAALSLKLISAIDPANSCSVSTEEAVFADRPWTLLSLNRYACAHAMKLISK